MTAQEIAQRPVTAFYFGEKQEHLQRVYENLTGEKVSCTMCEIRKMYTFVCNFVENIITPNNDMKEYEILPKFKGSKMVYGGKVITLDVLTPEKVDIIFAAGNGFMLKELPTAKQIAVPEPIAEAPIVETTNEPTNEITETSEATGAEANAAASDNAIPKKRKGK